MKNSLIFIILGLMISLQAFAAPRVVTPEMEAEAKSIAKFFLENPIQVVDDHLASKEKIFMLTKFNTIKFYRADHAPVTLILHSVNPTIVSIDGSVFYATDLMKTTKIFSYFVSEAYAEWGGWTRELYEGVARGVEEKVERYEVWSGRAGVPGRVPQPGDGASMGGLSYSYGPSNDYIIQKNATGQKFCFSQSQKKAVSEAFCGFSVSMGSDGKQHCFSNVSEVLFADKYCGYSALKSNDGNTYCYLNSIPEPPVSSRYCGGRYAKANDGKTYCYATVLSSEPSDNSYCDYSIRIDKDGKDRCYSNAKNQVVADKLCGTIIRKGANGKNACFLEISSNKPVANEVCGFRVANNKSGEKVCYLNVAPDVALDISVCEAAPKKTSVPVNGPQKVSLKVVPIENTEKLSKKSLTMRMNDEFDQYQCLILNGAQGILKEDKSGVSIDREGKISLCNDKSCESFTPGKNPNAVLTTKEAEESVKKFQDIEQAINEVRNRVNDHQKMWTEKSLPAQMEMEESFIDKSLAKIELFSEAEKSELKKACKNMSSETEVLRTKIEKSITPDASLKIMLDSLEIKKSDTFCVNTIPSKILNDIFSKVKNAILAKALSVNEVKLANKVEILKEYSTCCAEKKCKDNLADNAKEQKVDVKLRDGNRAGKPGDSSETTYSKKEKAKGK